MQWKDRVGVPAEAALPATQDFMQRHGAARVADALDIGCSAGVSSRFLAAEFPSAQVTGVDLSPHFLAVAEWRER